MPRQFTPYKVQDLSVRRVFGVCDQVDELNLKAEQVRAMLNLFSPYPGEMRRRKGAAWVQRMPVLGGMHNAKSYFDVSLYCVGNSVLVEDAV